MTEELDVEISLAGIFDALAESGVIAPLELGGADEAKWLDCELASLAENRLAEIDDPFTLSEERRRDWLARATLETLYAPSDRDIDRCFWLMSEGERAGTVALATNPLGSDLVRLSSLYVAPSHRKRGLGRKSLAAIRDALGRSGYGMKLTTSWAWQRTVRFYMDLGLWVRMWKREIELRWDARRKPPTISIDDRVATLSADLAGESVELFRALRDGDRLLLDSTPLAEKHHDLRLEAASTFALALALHGWPLIRSDADWSTARWADAGAPEALAYRIMIWEAWDRHHGWRVETPRVPGLVYSTWPEIEAEWEEQEAALR